MVTLAADNCDRPSATPVLRYSVSIPRQTCVFPKACSVLIESEPGFGFVAFSSREPVTTSLESAINGRIAMPEDKRAPWQEWIVPPVIVPLFLLLMVAASVLLRS
jgi:hypothetical protein